MARPILAQVLRVAALACFIPIGAQAEPFKCPHIGGEFTFGQESNVNSLDQMISTTISTRNVAMNVFETLMTRDENNRPINDLAASMTEAPDHMSYTFKLRQGVKFHNGKPMSSADVVASFERYSKIGTLRIVLANVAGWDTPDAETFVIRMKKPHPSFIPQLSSFSLPIVIIPAENKDDPPQQLKTIGTGPWQMVDFTPGSAVKLRRYDGYTPNTNFEDRDGFGGYKQACFDTVTFRIVTEPGARVAGLKTGELQAVEDLPTKALAGLKTDKDITLLPLQNWQLQIAQPNTSVPPTDNLNFRKAVQAALDMDDIMDAATDGNYRLNVGLQYPAQDDYTDAGKETYNIKDSARAKQYLQQSGYKGEPVILLTTREISAMYNASLVMAEQIKAVGINAQLKLVDWPTAAKMAQKPDTGWNFFFTSWGTVVAMGGLDVIQILINPNAVYHPKDGKDDPDLLAAWSDMNNLTDPAARQEAFTRAQKIALERVYTIPFGALTKVQAVRSNVQGFKPFRIPRMSNVWFAQ